MKPFELAKDVFWIGAVDFNKRNFHGYSRSPKGTTYNAYLIRDEKNVVFDTVDNEYAGTMFCRLAKALPLEKVDYSVVNHTEKDHSGALCQLVERCKPEKIFVSTIGKRFLDAQFDTTGWPIQVVKTGDVINIGKRNIHFVETRMLHWPDSMVSYIPEEKMLISNDAFGQNIASSERFVDQYDRSLLEQAIKEYYYNIVLPFSPMVLKTLDLIASMGIEIETIAPDHGLIFRTAEDCRYILETYRTLAEQKPQPRALIVYDSMWGSTGIMASAIGTGLEEEGIPYRILDIQKNHHSDVMTELANCGAVLVGSATHNNTILPEIADVLTYMKGLRPLNRVGAAFGSYGWSGESAKIIQEHLASMHMELPAEPLKIPFVPKHEGLAQCVALGRTVAAALKAKCGIEN